MPVYTPPGRETPFPTFKYLDDIVTILGSTKLAFWPGLSTNGVNIQSYGAGSDVSELTSANETSGEQLEDDFNPMVHTSGIVSYYFDSTLTNNMIGLDNASLSHAGATGFSLGAWIMMTEALGTKRSIISKYDATGAAEVREYTFDIDTSGNLILELYDESANASEIGTGASDVLVPFQWTFIVATYDGTAATPDVHLYKNASDTLAAGTTTESGSFVDMEDLASLPCIGAQRRAASTVQEFEGRIALPFITGKELTSAEVSSLYRIGQRLIGLVA